MYKVSGNSFTNKNGPINSYENVNRFDMCSTTYSNNGGKNFQDKNSNNRSVVFTASPNIKHHELASLID